VEVLRGLRARGWDVDCQVGVSGYRIDLGVRHPDHPGAYLAGVECDGAAYHSSANARERDLLRQTVLEGLGWTLHRVWSTDWWMDRDGQLERLQAKLEADLARARAGAPPVAEPPAAPPAPEPVAPRPGPPPLPPLARPTFRAPALPAGPKDAFAEPQSRGLLLAQIRLLADAGPLTRDHAVLLIREAWGFRQAGARIRARIEALLDEAGHPGELLWPPAADREALPPLRAADPADPASERAPDHLPVPELASGALEALDEAKVLTIDELSRVVAARAGLRRGAALQERLQRAVELLAARGLAAVDGDRARRLDRG
jgi:very-short-patch-repair endonuclease